ncbi:MAG: agmatinase [Nanoarchaeota archaeon]|nr:agmatinase [Nanoarchaeota archaeon]
MSRKVFGSWGREFSKYETSKVVLLPVPYNGTSTWIKGADFGPNAIIEASKNFELYDIETKSLPYKARIHTLDELQVEDLSPEKMTELVKLHVRNHLRKGKLVGLLGGEHSVSIGSIEAHAEKYPGIGFLQLDAHADTREEYHYSKYNHACVMARARELREIVQIGIRSMCYSEKKGKKRDLTRIFFAKDIHDNDSWMDKAISILPENFYLTVDLDVFDPSIMPSTGTPEPGGLGWYQTLKFLKKAITEKNMVGFDVVELCPNPHNKAPDMLAAQLIYKIIAYKYRKRDTSGTNLNDLSSDLSIHM